MKNLRTGKNEQPKDEGFAKRLRNARDSVGLKQKEVADRVDITQSAYSKIENGQYWTRDKRLIEKIAVVVNSYPAWLEYETGPQFRTVKKTDKDSDTPEPERVAA